MTSERFETFPVILLKASASTWILWDVRSGRTVVHTYSHPEEKTYKYVFVDGSLKFVHDSLITSADLTKDGRVLILKNYSLFSYDEEAATQPSPLFTDVSGIGKLPDDSLILFDRSIRPSRAVGTTRKAISSLPPVDYGDHMDIAIYGHLIYWQRRFSPGLTQFTDYDGNRVKEPLTRCRVLNGRSEPSGVIFLTQGNEVTAWYPALEDRAERTEVLTLPVKGEDLAWLSTVDGFSDRLLAMYQKNGSLERICVLLYLDGRKQEIRALAESGATFGGMVDGGLVAFDHGELTSLRTLRGELAFCVKIVEAVIHSSPTRLLHVVPREWAVVLSTHSSPEAVRRIVLDELDMKEFAIIQVNAVPESERALVCGFARKLFSELLTRDLVGLVGRYV